MIKYVMVKFNDETGECVVKEPQDDVVVLDYSTTAEMHLPRGARKIEFTNPLSMTVYDDENPVGRARTEGYNNAIDFGRNEVWRIVGDILFDPDYSTDFMIFGGWKCQSDIFKDTYGHVFEVIRKWRGQPKRFDIVKIPFTDGEKEAIITRVDGDQVDLMFKGGRTTRRNIANVTKTGRTLEYGLTKWVKGE